MGDVVPFIARVRSSGDWTAAERARLEELAERLTGAGGARVETVFGATDSGDPWCVVTDENGDVLIHVARIDGKFVVHSAVDDALSEGADLHSALRDRLIPADDEDDAAVVVPFGLGGRQAQTFLALVIATAFFYETVEFADAAEAAPAPLPETPLADPPPPPPDIKTPTQERELAVQGAALAEPTPVRPSVLAFAATVSRAGEINPAEAQLTASAAPTLASAPEAAPVETITLAQAPAPEVRTLIGTSGDDVLVGTAADERLLGGGGDDTLRGGGGNDLLEGGGGDDHLELGAEVTAIGGAGADTFEIVAPKTLGQADTLLGVVVDFSLVDGDKIVWQGQTIPLNPPSTDPTDSPDPTAPGLTEFGTAGGGGGHPDGSTDRGSEGAGPFVDHGFGLDYRRVDVDLDGDGVNDGYVLVYATVQSVIIADPMGILSPPPYSASTDIFG